MSNSTWETTSPIPEGQDLRRKVKRKAATIESQKPKGPEVRKQEGKGTEGSDVPKEQKKQ